jgi:hypothetical protein
VLWPPGLLLPLQRPLVHLLSLVKLALGCVKETEVINYSERRRVLWPPGLLVAL